MNSLARERVELKEAVLKETRGFRRNRFPLAERVQGGRVSDQVRPERVGTIKIRSCEAESARQG
jgi:hypothetical protein